jgi:hypothetical protein
MMVIPQITSADIVFKIAAIAESASATLSIFIDFMDSPPEPKLSSISPSVT